MNPLSKELNFENAVKYHYGKFPPDNINYSALIKPISSASAALARYDQMLRNMHNSEFLLAPLRFQEAVISSRIEGTISTLDEVLRYEADQEEDSDDRGNYRNEAIEVFLYHRAMQKAQKAIEDGAPLTSWLMRAAHSVLLDFGRGANQSPGEFKTEQNYLVDKGRRKVLFIPISPEQLETGIENLLHFINNEEWEVLTKTALTHIEFEALHPFKDGNGRIGRMLIPLLLWKYGIISAPHFYISEFFESNKDEYIDRMREASKSGQWTEWCVFFVNALEAQANENLEVTEKIKSLYDEMKEIFREKLASQWSTAALDFVFSNPVFRNTKFTRRSGIPSQVASRMSRMLVENELLLTIDPPAGRRPALYAFEPLLEIVRR
ncbi:MAG: Fic family protein [Sneathiella sp.]|nr:Fic family protein [Sneathiella sp.]